MSISLPHNAIKALFLVITVAVITTYFSCGRSQNTTQTELRDSSITHSQLLQISHAPDYTLISISDPWNANRILHKYVLISKDAASTPANLPEGTIVKVPISNALVYSSVHASVIDELGSISSIKGICDAQYFKMPKVLEGIKQGTVTDCGSSLAPTVEQIIKMQAEAILLSPFQNAGYGHLEALQIPIIECADYMESTPLGRAEWIKFFGELFDRREEADSIFNCVAERYNSAKRLVANAETHPSVLSETVTGGVWFVPGGKSYIAQLYYDAAATHPWADNDAAGSLQLDFSQVLNRGINADVWLIKANDINTYRNLKSVYDLNDNFKAFKNRNVWVCNLNNTTLFEDFPFHPDLLLNDFIKIFHPELFDEAQKITTYYKPIE